MSIVFKVYRKGLPNSENLTVFETAQETKVWLDSLHRQPVHGQYDIFLVRDGWHTKITEEGLQACCIYEAARGNDGGYPAPTAQAS
jgi:hypothetical protein